MKTTNKTVEKTSFTYKILARYLFYLVSLYQKYIYSLPIWKLEYG